MSRFLQMFSSRSFQILKTVPRLKENARFRTTSEHLLKPSSKPAPAKDEHPWKSQRQVVMEVKTHMNFLPIPEGRWEEYYKSQNLKWTRMLCASVASLVITVYCLYKTDCFYFHSMPSIKEVQPDQNIIGRLERKTQ